VEKPPYFDLSGFSASFIITSNKWRNKMSDLKSAWEISMEKSDKLIPGVKKQKKLTAKQKEQIAEIRKEFKAKIADKDVTLQHKLNRLAERTPPEQLVVESEKLKQEFVEEKDQLEKEMEVQVEAIRKPSK
jgi:Spy/CpxP family protein refolding chaperone